MATEINALGLFSTPNVISAFIGAFAALVVQSFAKVWDHLKERTKEDKHTHYLALQLVFYFESVADTMFNKITDQELEEQTSSDPYFHGPAGPPIKEPFEFSDFPKSDDYKLLQKNLLIRIMNFPNQMLYSSRFIHEVFQKHCSGNPQANVSTNSRPQTTMDVFCLKTTVTERLRELPIKE